MKPQFLILGMVIVVCNPSTKEERQGHYELKASLGYILSSGQPELDSTFLKT